MAEESVSPPIVIYVRDGSPLFSFFYIFSCSVFVFNIRVSVQEDKASSGDQDCK